MFKVALISVFDQGTHGYRLVSASLKAAGFDVHNIFFGNRIIQDVPSVSERELAALEHLVREIQPDLVGCSITSLLCHPAAAAVAARAKKAVDVPVVFGGPYPSLLPQYCMDNAPIDYVCVGEAEEAAVELAARLSEGRAADDIPGIRSRRSLAFIRRDPPEDLDALPFPDIDRSDKKYLIDSTDGSIIQGDPYFRSYAYITKASRNCPFNCSFCSAPNVRQLSPAGKALRRRTVPRIMAEIRYARELNPNVHTCGFWDDTFPAEAGFIREFTAAYKKEVGLPFHIWAHPRTVKKENAILLAEAGLAGVIMGIESASEQTRRAVFNRPETNKDIAFVDETWSKWNLLRTYDLIIDHPWESPTEMEETFELMSRLQAPFEINMHSLVLFPESALARRAIREGLFRDEKEVIDAIFSDLDDARYRVQWVNHIPKLKDIRRAYWVFLILCLGNSKLSGSLVRRLAGSRLLRRYPELLTDVEVIDMRRANDQLGGYVLAAYRTSRLMRWVFHWAPSLERALDRLFKKSVTTALVCYLADRLVRRGPGLLLRRLRGEKPESVPETRKAA